MRKTVPSISNQGRGELGRNGTVSAGREQDGKVQNIENQVHGSPTLRECVCHVWDLGLVIHV